MKDGMDMLLIQNSRLCATVRTMRKDREKWKAHANALEAELAGYREAEFIRPVRCRECRRGELYMAVGDGINEPPYIEKVKCETGLRTYPDDYCSYGAQRDKWEKGGAKHEL